MKIKINFADVGNKPIVYNFIMGVLSKKYDVKICDNPDYIFCGDFLTGEYLKYDAVRIFIGGECEWPDLNSYDYAIDLVDMKVDDRYLRWPFYLWRDGTRDEFELALSKHHRLSHDITTKKFCNQVVSNGMSANPFRKEFYEELSKYKKIDSGGTFLNNLGYKVENKLEFQKNYKFSLAFENTSQKGYITEKIVEAWAAGTIPIYWGASDIAQEFNERAFINCNKYTSIEEVIDVIREIDNDDGLYNTIMQEPIINNSSRANNYLNDNVLLDFLDHIFRQGKMAYRRERYAWGKAKESERLRLIKQSHYYNLIKRIKDRENNISELFFRHNARSIALYGKGLVGEQLLEELQKEKLIDVVAIYDRSLWGKNYMDIPIFDIEQKVIENVDCIINTVWGMKEYIIEKCQNRIKVFDIDEILE